MTSSEIQHTIIETINGVNIEMVLVKGGTFTMGLQTENKKAKNYIAPTFYEYAADQLSYFFYFLPSPFPAHRVRLPDFYIGKYPLTQEQWMAVMGPKEPLELQNLHKMRDLMKLEPLYDFEWKSFINNNPSVSHVDDNFPVENINMYDIEIFLKKLQKITQKPYRLPTEAEWEFTAGEGIYRNPHILSHHDFPDDYTWEDELCTQDIPNGKANKLGVYNMLDTVYEWCSDTFSPYPYTKQKKQKINSRFYYIIRGSIFENLSENDINFFIYNRLFLPPYFGNGSIGFRLALPIS